MLQLQTEDDVKKVIMTMRKSQAGSLHNHKLWKKREPRGEKPINLIQFETAPLEPEIQDQSSSDEFESDEETVGPRILVAGQNNAQREERKTDGESCTHCGSQKHADLQCWKRLTCQKCGKKGHPTDRCFWTCKGCGEVHAKGECRLELLYNHLMHWYEPSKHAGLLPPQVEKLLN